jgi:hypothetical protein
VLDEFLLKKNSMNQKCLTLSFVLLTFCTVAAAQLVDWKKVNQANSDEILLKGQPGPTKALLLGSFHFGYPNLDAHKIDSSKMIDVLSPQRQKEIRQLVDVIKSYNPTRIYIESRNQRYTDSIYNAYLQGNYTLGRDERDQLAFRLAKELNHHQLYAVDANTFANQNAKRYTWIDSLWSTSVPVDSVKSKKRNALYTKLYNTGDSLIMKNTLLETFLIMANEKNLKRGHGAYIHTGTTANNAPDILSIWWYNRNLRIFNNILKTKPQPEDRILVLFGNGHMSILRHLFESSPEFEIIELKNLVMQMEKSKR